MNLHLDGRVALVCGSSTGLGFAIARALVDEGCRVAMNARHEERLGSAVAELGAPSSTVDGFAADVGRPDQCEQLVRQVQERFGALDILVCNAGGPPSVVFAGAPSESWQEALDLNLLSTIHLCRAAVPMMRSTGWGRIVCLTSIAAKEPMPGLILSTTARAGVLGFAKSLAREEAAHGITVNVVCPGYMRTERVEELVQARAGREGRSPDEVRSELMAQIPIGRMGDPAELAAAFAFLVSEPASYITGVALQVDGGYIKSIV
jgi:3-oxoacyl-[acyl-carrier protein] reductase